ncbi:MAG: hemerythrin domain-containing protein [Burkholderiales bacterium]
MDATALLMADHKKVEKLFKDFEKLEDAEEKRALVEKCCTSLKIHTQIEEEIFYPAARGALKEADLLNEAEVEHATAKDLIEQLASYDGEDEKDDAKFTVLAEYIRHHVKEEQNEMFPKLKKSKGLDLQEIGEQLKQRKEELMSEMGVDPMEVEEESPRKRASTQAPRMAAKRR